MTKYTIVPGLLLLFFVPLGLFCIRLSITERIEGNASLLWPVAVGIIDSAEIGTSHSDHYTSYSPSIAYHYSVASNTYAGYRIRYAAIGGVNYSESKLIIDRYPSGSTVRVYYNLNHPEDSVLEPGVFGRSWGLLLAGFLFSGVGLCLWIFRSKLEHHSLRN